MARTHRLPGQGAPAFDIIFHPKAEKEFFELADQVQNRFERALDAVAVDPFRARPGVDLKKLADVGPGETLYRLRVGDYRSVYVIISGPRKIWVLLFDPRGTGYDRLVKTATARRRPTV